MHHCEMDTYRSGRVCSSVTIAPLILYVVLLLFVQLVYIPEIHAETSDDVKRLLVTLLTTDGYNDMVRPIYDLTQAVSVNLSLYLTGILELDSQKESLITSGYLIVSWYDYYLQWNPSEYNETTYIFMRPDVVWKPDISLKNAISEVKGLGSSELLLTVNHDGYVSWSPYTIFQSTCKVDITYFPFDSQTCSLIFTAWSYYNYEVELRQETDVVMLNDYEENSLWEVVGSNVYKWTQPTESTLVFKLMLKRKPLFYLINVIIPVIMLSILNACVFVLPAKSSEKASFAVTVFLSLAVFLTIVTSTLPQNSDNVSYLGIYLVIMTSFSTSTVIWTLLQLRLHCRDENTDPVSWWLIKLQRFVDRVRCRRCNKVHPAAQAQNGHTISVSEWTSTKDEKTSEVKVIPTSERDTTLEVTWNKVSNSLDFILFWLYFTAVISTTVAMLFTMAKDLFVDELKRLFRLIESRDDRVSNVAMFTQSQMKLSKKQTNSRLDILSSM